jgi:hypothetical protein
LSNLGTTTCFSSRRKAPRPAGQPQHDSAEIVRTRRLLDEDSSLERAWSKINDAPARAAASTSQSPGPEFSFGAWNTMSIDALYRAFNTRSSTPQATVEAVIVAVRERGLAALKNAANVERLGRCDHAARAEINQRIARLIEHKGS